MATKERQVLMDKDEVEDALRRMAHQIIDRNGGTDHLLVLGIRRRGVELAEAIQGYIEEEGGVEIPSGALDITLYRDDLMAIGPRPVVGESTLPLEGVEGRAVVIVDDVLFTGRTVRAAINELMDWGRPARIDLCVLVDRGGRELPIQPDVVGRRVEVRHDQIVEVLVPEQDGRLAVELVPRPEAAA